MIEYLLIGGAALGGVAWERLRRRRLAKQYAAFYASLSPEVQVVLHVANHEAQQRRQPLTPAHLAYGLLQDDDFVAAVKSVGGDPDAIESRALAEIERGAPEPADGQLPEAVLVIAHTAAIAQGVGRLATCGDIFNRLVRSSGGALFEAAPLTPNALQFYLAHRSAPPPTTLPDVRDVFVVIRNDDWTTKDLVVRVLTEVFDLTAATAEKLMTEVHEGGRGIVGRFANEIAKHKIEAARAVADRDKCPLWIGAEHT